MIINGIDVPQYQLSYDKILKNTLAQSDELTIRFINGLFDDNIPLNATVDWLDKESVDDEYKAIVADFYPKIDGRMYAIEIEQDDNGNMALRIFKYTIGGAIRHNMTATKAVVKIRFPQPCVIFLNSTKNTPQELHWEIEFFDGQCVALRIPTIRLAELTVEEIARRDLFPIGQFYLRTFGLLNDKNVEAFQSLVTTLITHLKEAVQQKTVPFDLAVQMQETIRRTAANAFYKAKQGGFTMEQNILETLPWIDYRVLYQKLEERGRTEGIEKGIAKGIEKGIAKGRAKGRTERDMEIALRMFERKDGNQAMITQLLQDLGISDEIIEAAGKTYEAGYRQNT